MKRYLTLLTVSFLSTTTLVKAGGFDIFNLPEDHDEKMLSLQAKAAKLQKNIDNTENADLRDAFTRQQGVITGLLNSPLTDLASNAYFEAQGQKNKIKTTFVEEVRNGSYEQQFNKIHEILHSGIYGYESQELNELDLALRLVNQIANDYYPTMKPAKAASRYLKMEKLITQHVQKADEVIERFKDDAKKIKASGVKKDLEIIKYSFDYNSPEYATIEKALNYLWEIDRGGGYCLGEQIENILGYKALEKEVEPLLASYRQSRQETPAFIASVFSGVSEYSKLEDALSSRHSYSYDNSEEGREFLRIMRQISELPTLLMRLKELQPKVQELLEMPENLGDQGSSYSYSGNHLPLDWAPDSFPLDFDAAASSSYHVAKTFRTAGVNERAEIKHSAVYASFSYQNNPDAEYWLIINHRTKDKGSVVRVHNPNAKAYIDLGRLPSSRGFSDEVFNLSSLFASVSSSSSGSSVMRTELNFMDGISDIHSFTIKSDEKTLMEVILGDEDSEKQAGVHVYAPELPGKPQEWSEKKSDV